MSSTSVPFSQNEIECPFNYTLWSYGADNEIETRTLHTPCLLPHAMGLVDLDAEVEGVWNVWRGLFRFNGKLLTYGHTILDFSRVIVAAVSIRNDIPLSMNYYSALGVGESALDGDDASKHTTLVKVKIGRGEFTVPLLLRLENRTLLDCGDVALQDEYLVANGSVFNMRHIHQFSAMNVSVNQWRSFVNDGRSGH